MRSFSRISAASLDRLRCSTKTENPTNNSTNRPSRYHGQTGLADVEAAGATTGAGALLTGDGAYETCTDEAGGTITAELTGALEDTGAEAAGAELAGAAEDEAGFVAGAAVTMKLATPVVLEVCPLTRSRCVPAGVLAGTTKSTLTMPSESARTAGRAVESSLTWTSSPLAKPANSTSWDPPAITDAERMVLGCTVVGAPVIVLVTTGVELTVVDDEVDGAAEDDAVDETGVDELGVDAVV